MRRLAHELELDPMLARCLVHRGATDAASARAFLEPSVDELLDPFLLPDMEVAAERLARAIRDHETVLVHGDADVDGLSGTALLCQFLRTLSLSPQHHVPNRAYEDYSFSAKSLDRIKECGATLVISVDNGTTAYEPVAELQRRGVDVIITDHHLPDAKLPPALAVVNPVRADSVYPNRALAGVAVAFKLCCATASKLPERQQRREEVAQCLGEALAWVAMGTVSDVMALQGENRVLVSRGLRALSMNRSPGLAALRRVCKIGSRCEAEDIAFRLAPRINAAARMGQAELAVRLVTTTDEGEAVELARTLDATNRERQAAERVLLMEIEALLGDHPPEEAIVLAGEGWNPGLLGLVSGRLARARGVPAVLVGLHDDGPCKGSTRSVAGFDARAALASCEAHLITFGGHAMAAGFAVQPEKIPELRAGYCAAWDAHRENAAELAPLEYEGDLPLVALTPGLVGGLDRLGPFGEGNRRPVMGALGVQVVGARRMGGDGSHLQLQLTQGNAALRGVAFSKGDLVDELPDGLSIDALYTPKINRFRGRSEVELELVDLRPRDAAAPSPTP